MCALQPSAPSPEDSPYRLLRAIAMGVLITAAVALALLAMVGVARAQSELSITADQGLSPAFSPAIHDYVVRCTGTPVVIGVDAPSDVAVSVDHSQLRSGSFQRAVPLGEGQEFSIAVRRDGATDHYYVRCLPSDFPSYTFTTERPGPPGLFTTDTVGSYLEVFDTDGVPVWWMKTAGGAFDTSVLADGTVGFFDGAAGMDEIYTLDGRPLHGLTAAHGDTDLHELQLLQNGNYIIDSYVPRDGVDLSPHGPSNANVFDGEVEELTPDGRLVWAWNSSSQLTPGDTPQFWYDAGIQDDTGRYDLVHLNSVDEHGSEVVISARHTDAVWGIDRSTGRVLWKLGGTPRAESLSVAQDPFAAYPLRGNHDARILSDGTLTVHDNFTGCDADPASCGGQSPPLRAAHYRIDEQARTATLLDSLSDPDVPTSFCCGSARRMPGGGWLTSWGGNPVVAGYDSSGRRTFELRFDDGFSYRAVPVPATTTIEDLRAGMNAQYPRVDSDLPPVASFGAAPNPAAAGAMVRFDASASEDPDGAIVSYEWDFGDGQAGSGPTPTHVYAKPGDYLVRLTVRDDAGSLDTTSHTVAVLSGAPSPPHALFTALPGSAPTGTAIGFDATASNGGDGTIISYLWQFGDGAVANGPLASHAYAHAGDYPVRLTVTGEGGLSDTVTRVIHIIDRPPGASFTAAPAHPRAGRTERFSAHAHDPDGRVVSYRWTFGDGASASGRAPRHAYRRPGRYRVTLTVRDDSGSVTRRARTLTVR